MITTLICTPIFYNKNDLLKRLTSLRYFTWEMTKEINQSDSSISYSPSLYLFVKNLKIKIKTRLKVGTVLRNQTNENTENFPPNNNINKVFQLPDSTHFSQAKEETLDSISQAKETHLFWSGCCFFVDTP